MHVSTGNLELDQLMNDPIIIGMVEEIKLFGPVHSDIKGYDIKNIPWNFMMRANGVYRERGGQNHKTIGGPAKAVVTIVQNEKD